MDFVYTFDKAQGDSHNFTQREDPVQGKQNYC